MEISALPDDVLLRIFRHLLSQQLLEVRRVCRHWRDLALHPDVWRTRSFRTDYGSKGLMRAILNRAPCARRLVSAENAIRNSADHGVLLCTTACAVERLEVDCDLQTSSSTTLVVASIIRNQVMLGRLKKLALWMSADDPHADVVGVLHMVALVVGIEGLLDLKLTVFTTADQDDWMPMIRWCRDPPTPPTASLRSLYFSAIQPPLIAFFQPLLTCHASTLRELDVSFSCIPAAVLVSATQLRELKSNVLDDMSLLLALPHLRELTLLVGFDKDCDPAWVEAALANARVFLEGVTQQLTHLELNYLYDCADGGPGVDLVLAVAAPRKSAVQSLVLDCEDCYRESDGLPPVHLQPLAAALPGLTALGTLIIKDRPSGDFLRAITPQTAPCLVSVKLDTMPDFLCLHEWIHRDVGDLLKKNPRLHLFVAICYSCSEDGCDYCCDLQCHPHVSALVKRSLDLSFPCVLVGHAEAEGCGLRHEKSELWVVI